MKKILFTFFALNVTLLGFSQSCSTCDPAYASDPNLSFDTGPTNEIVIDEIVVSGTGIILSDLNVYVEVDHTSNIDFSITLSNVESGLSVALYIGIYDGCGQNLAVEYDDEAGGWNCDGANNPALGGCMQPSVALNTFDDIPFDGTWTMTVSDQLPVLDNGVFKHWCLIPTGGGGGAPLLAPACAETPVPADNSINQCNIGTVLSFSAPAPAATPVQDPTGYNLSLWTDNGSIVYLEKDTDLGMATSFAITDVLTPGETYYWQVKPYNDLETNETCDVWSFVASTLPNPKPVIDVDGNNASLVNVCSNQDAAFGLTDANGTSYTTAIFDWNGTDNTKYPLSDTTIANPVFNSSVFGTTYELALLVTDTNGCSGVDTVNVFVKEGPTAGSISSSDGLKICYESSTDLSLSGYNGDIEWQYSYASATTGLLTTGTFGDAYSTFPIMQNTYFVAIVELNGCVETTNVYIEKVDLPFQPIIRQPLSFCGSDSIPLIAVWPVQGTLTWNDVDFSVGDSLWITEPGLYKVTGEALSGCKNTSAIRDVKATLSVDDPVVTHMDGSTCIGDSLTVNVSLENGDNIIAFIDYIEVNRYATDATIIIKSNTNYQFVNISNEGCVSDTTIFNATFGTMPNNPVAVKLSDDSLQANGSAAEYYWYLSDGTLMGVESDDIFLPTANGVYYVVGANGWCFSGPSNQVVVDQLISIESGVNNVNDVHVYPNPSQGLFHVNVYQNNAEITLTDISGKIILRKQLNKGVNKVDLNLERGIYLMLIHVDGRSHVERVVIE